MNRRSSPLRRVGYGFLVFTVLFCVMLHEATAADLPELVDILAATPEGGWVRVNLNQFSDVWAPADLRPLKSLSNPTPSKIILAWSSYAWDPNRGALWLYGGGHANYTGNDMYWWSGQTRMWQRASLPSEIRQDDLGNWNAIDGPDAAPASAHTYDSNIFLPIIDRFVTFGGAAYGGGGPYWRQHTATTSRRTGPYFFDPARAHPDRVGGTTGSHVKRVAPHPEIVGGNMWVNRDIYVNIPGGPSLPSTHVNGCTAYAEENGRDVVYVGANSGSTSQSLYRYVVTDVADPSRDTWEKVGRYWGTPTDQPACGYDPVRKVFVKRGMNSHPFAYWNLNTPGPLNNDVMFTPTDPTGEFAQLLASNSINLRLCGLDFDPVRSVFVLWCGDTRVWSLTPPSPLSPQGWTIRRQPAGSSAAVPNGNAGTGILGKWKYIADIDAFLGLQDDVAGNIWLYKPFGWMGSGTGGNAKPLVAIVEPGEGTTYASGDPINVVANATDTDGTIARVQFFGGSTLLGQDTAPPYSVVWNDAPPGTHVLTAVAVDNQGAQTASGPVHVTVTAANAPAGSGTVTLRHGLNGYTQTRDTYLSSYHPTLAFGSTASLPDQRTYYSKLVRFAIFDTEGGPLPAGVTIHSATLSLYKYSAYDVTYAVHRLLRDWSEASATWQQPLPGQAWAAPGASGLGTDYAGVADAQAAVGWDPGWVHFDVTNAVQQMSTGQVNHGWRLVPVAGSLSGLKKFYSRESVVSAELLPTLTITYSTE